MNGFILKLLAAIFPEHDRLAPPESALEQARLMRDVLARQHHAVGALGLRGQDEKRESSLVEHLLQSLGVGDAADCCSVALGAGVSHRMLRSPGDETLQKRIGACRSVGGERPAGYPVDSTRL